MGGFSDKDFMTQVKQQIDANLKQHGMDIAVIDDSDTYGFLASATRLDEIYMSDVKSMVANVLKKAGTYEIRRLDVIDHGNDYSFQIGKDWISPKTLGKYEPELSRLRGRFHASGFVHLQHCDIGMNKDLLVSLAKIWGVSVYAGTGAHRAQIRYQSGDYVRADPNGRVYPTGRPGVHVRYIGDTGDIDHADSSGSEPRLVNIKFKPKEAPRLGPRVIK